MKTAFSIFHFPLSIACLLAAMAGCATWADPDPGKPAPFVVYDATVFADSDIGRGLPQRYDWKKTVVVFTSSIILPGQTSIDPNLLAATVGWIGKAPYLAVVTDVEGVWAMSSEQEIWIDANAQAMILRLLRSRLPVGVKLGCWSRCPLTPTYFGQWYQHLIPVSDDAGEAIAQAADLLFLDLQCWTTDANAWEVSARVVLTKARRYKKPVIAFVSWQHGGGLGGPKVELAYWKRIVSVCRELADGMCIWGCGAWTPDKNLPWTAEDDERAAIVNEAVRP